MEQVCCARRDVLCFFSKLNDFGRFFRSYCRRAVEGFGFSGNEIDVLISLEQHPERNTVKGISESVHLSRGVISRAVESLRKKGFLKVLRTGSDRRTFAVALSEKAAPIAEKLSRAVRDFVKAIFRGLSQEELSSITQTVGEISRNKEKMQRQAAHSQKEADTVS